MSCRAKLHFLFFSSRFFTRIRLRGTPSKGHECLVGKETPDNVKKQLLKVAIRKCRSGRVYLQNREYLTTRCTEGKAPRLHPTNIAKFCINLKCTASFLLLLVCLYNDWCIRFFPQPPCMERIGFWSYSRIECRTLLRRSFHSSRFTNLRGFHEPMFLQSGNFRHLSEAFSFCQRMLSGFDSCCKAALLD